MKTIKILIPSVLVGIAIGGVVLAQSLYHQEQPIIRAAPVAFSKIPLSVQNGTHNSFQSAYKPFSPEERKAADEDSARTLKIEKEAQLLIKQRRFPEAISACNRLLARGLQVNGEPTNMQALQWMGDIYLEQKRYKDAIDAYNRAQKHTRNIELSLNIALAYVRLGDLVSARKFYSEERFFNEVPQSQKAEYFSQLPGTKTAKALEASIFYARGCEKDSYDNNEGAAEDYQQVLKTFPNNGLVSYRLAEKLMRLKRYNEALPMWARAARFGKGENAKDAKNRMGGFPVAQREKAMRDVEEL